MSKIVNERIENMDKSATDDHNLILILVVRPMTN